MVSLHVQSVGIVPQSQVALSCSPLLPRPDSICTAARAPRPAVAPLALASPGTAAAHADSITVQGVTVTLAQAAAVAPIVLLHPAEHYLPCSAEYLLENAELVPEAGARIKNPSGADLQTHRGRGARVVVDAAHFGGQPLADQQVRAPMYVSVQVAPDKQSLDLNYLFLYAFNGAQTVRVRVPGGDYNCVLPHIAEHGGDIECITVRVAADFSRVHFVRTEAHGHSHFFTRPAEEVEFENGHPLIYSAYSSHGSYNVSGNPSDSWITDRRASALGFGVDFIDVVSRQGPRWQPFATNDTGQAVPNGQLRFVGVQAGQPLGDQVWAAFAGQIGEPGRKTFVGATAVGGGPLSAAQRSWANWLTKAVVGTGAVNGRLQTDGIPGLGERPVAQAGDAFWDPT